MCSLPLSLGPSSGQLRFENAAQVVRLPVLGGLVVDHPGHGIPQRHGPAIRAAGAVGRVPCTPLAARERPGVALAENVFDLAFVAHGVANVARDIACAGPLEAMLVDIGVIVVINVDKLKRAEIDAVGAERPGPVEIIRVENLECQGHPAARRAAVQEAGVGLGRCRESALRRRESARG